MLDREVFDKSDSPVEPETGCQPCTACCTCMAVPALEKPKFKSCVHLVQVGCGIYEDRPRACRSWSCLWRRGIVVGGPEMRPDELGLMFENTTQASQTIFGKQCFLAYETRPDSRQEPLAQAVLEKIACQFPVALWRADGFWLGGPPLLVERAVFNLRRRGYTKVGDMLMAPEGQQTSPYM